MLAQSERLGRLVEQLLDLSKLESGEVPLRREAVSLGPLVSQVMSEIEVASADRDVDVRSDMPDDLPSIEADPERVHQVLFNLVDNAVRFTPEGGEVRIEAHRHNGSVEVSVADTGVGIPAEALPRLFERFYRVDTARAREDGGTGHRPRDRAIRRGGTRWHDPRRERARPGQHLHLRSAGRSSGGPHEQEGSVKSVTTTVTISAPERYAFLDLTDDLRRADQGRRCDRGRRDRLLRPHDVRAC